MQAFILQDYFDWLYFKVTNDLGYGKKSYRKLMKTLHAITYEYHVDYDENRADDGERLRWYYVSEGGENHIMDWEQPCTVLEMLIGFAYQFESIMDSSDVDNSLTKWFWMFLENIDLANMKDKKYDREYIYERVNMFMGRGYDMDGNGNIIYIPDSDEDLGRVELWQQMCYFIDSII